MWSAFGTARLRSERRCGRLRRPALSRSGAAGRVRGVAPRNALPRAQCMPGAVARSGAPGPPRRRAGGGAASGYEPARGFVPQEVPARRATAGHPLAARGVPTTRISGTGRGGVVAPGWASRGAGAARGLRPRSFDTATDASQSADGRGPSAVRLSGRGLCPRRGSGRSRGALRSHGGPRAQERRGRSGSARSRARRRSATTRRAGPRRRITADRQLRSVMREHAEPPLGRGGRRGSGTGGRRAGAGSAARGANAVPRCR